MKTKSIFRGDWEAGVGLKLQKVVFRSVSCVRMLLAAWISVTVLPSLYAQTNSSATTALRDSREKIVLPLGGSCGEVTAVGYTHKGPPPWEKGNCLTFKFGHKELPGRVKEGELIRCYAVNVHAENLYEIVKKLQLKVVEAEIFHKHTYFETNFSGTRPPEVIKVEIADCIITDARIPRTWFRSEKPSCGCVSSKDWKEYVREYPEQFGLLDIKAKEGK